MLLHGGELLLHIFGLMGEDFLGILRLNELLGVIERRLQIRFGKAAFYGARSPALPRLHGAAAGARGYLPRRLVRQTEVGPEGRPPASDAELHLAGRTNAA
jgi:hypothetical protein